MALSVEQKEYLLALIEKKKQVLTKFHGEENSESYNDALDRLDELAIEIKEM